MALGIVFFRNQDPITATAATGDLPAAGLVAILFDRCTHILSLHRRIHLDLRLKTTPGRLSPASGVAGFHGLPAAFCRIGEFSGTVVIDVGIALNVIPAGARRQSHQIKMFSNVIHYGVIGDRLN